MCHKQKWDSKEMGEEHTKNKFHISERRTSTNTDRNVARHRWIRLERGTAKMYCTAKCWLIV
jgi:hypothetical protein